MDNNTIDSLKEALKFSPDNIPLRLHLAQTLLSANRDAEAETEFQQILAREGNNEKAKFGLATIFYNRGEYSTCNVILEELIHGDTTDIGLLILYTRALLKENEIGHAMEIYQRVLAIIPDFTDDELDVIISALYELQVNHEENDEHFLSLQNLINKIQNVL